MIKNIFLLVILICSLNVTSQQTIKKSFTHDGVERSYIMYIPAKYDEAQAVPLLFNFHGYGMTASSQLNYCDFRPIADTACFILVVPQGTLLGSKTHWKVGGWTVESTADDIGFANAMIDTLSANYNINSKRIYSTGFSNGGFFSFELACQLSNRIAAIGSVSGSMTPETYTNCKPSRPMPVIQIHGVADSLVLYAGTKWSKPAELAVSYWTNYNHTNTSANTTELPDIVTTDGSTVKRYTYSQGTACSNVEHLQVSGGDHTWPGASGRTNNKDINASVEIWNFLSRHTMDGCVAK
jgi:polyhydroxybutyrate depolymerase